MARDGKMVVLFNAGGAFYTCAADDQAGLRLAVSITARLRLAPVTTLAQHFKVHRATVHRARRLIEKGGVDAVQPGNRGPKGPHKLTPEVLRKAQAALDGGASQRETARRVDVSHFAIAHAIHQGRLRKPVDTQSTIAWVDEPTLSRPFERAANDQSCEAGVAVKRTLERALACSGKLAEAEPKFEAAEAVPNAGVLLAVPALEHEGLLEVGGQVYGGLSNGFFGLRSVLLTFGFMALLRIKTPEQLTEHDPGTLGLLLGLDRVPEVKTLRRKLAELGERGLVRTLMTTFTERWAKAQPDELGILYVDGHVRPYHGRTHVLPKHHMQQRGRPMPGTKDFHVNDRNAEPLFFVTAEATEGLLATLDEKLLPEVRRLVGPGRRVTMVFDREGWSPKRFAKWKKKGFDVLTYRKGKMSTWRATSFHKRKGRVGGELVEYALAERDVKLSNGMNVREIRRLAEDGHQTSVITTNKKLSTLTVAHRMFSRWRQENFFRYMRHEFALDHLCTHEVEPADPKRIVQLERERKMLIDTIKMAAYRAETSLTRLVEPLFARHEDESRKFLKSIFQATADLIPDRRRKSLTVRFHGLSSPRATRALAELCAVVNERDCVYPATDLKLRFEVPALQK
ncbi:MAG: hypothetical protein HY650_05475 [Acidobacteria bacterium]|nr:hypothetical protein [Acidobacteriota bacterium]